MYKQNVNLACIPQIFVIRSVIYPHVKLCLCKCLKNTLPVMLKSVKGYARFAVKALYVLHICVYLAIVKLDDFTVIVINSPAAKLKQFSRKHTCRLCCYRVFVYLKQ